MATLLQTLRNCCKNRRSLENRMDRPRHRS
jgi:hypothetical protein